MKIEKLYLTNIIPYLKEFKTCEIYNFELNKLYQELAESINQKNIYTALDLPDFVNTKEIKLETSIIKLSCKKLKIGNEVNLLKENGIKILIIDGEKYQLLFFPSGSVPEVIIKLEKLIFFMFQPKYQRIYYCGIYTIKKINSTTINSFYKNHCFNDSNKFIDFKNLLR